MNAASLLSSVGAGRTWGALAVDTGLPWVTGAAWQIRGIAQRIPTTAVPRCLDRGGFIPDASSNRLPRWLPLPGEPAGGSGFSVVPSFDAKGRKQRKREERL